MLSLCLVHRIHYPGSWTTEGGKFAGVLIGEGGGMRLVGVRTLDCAHPKLYFQSQNPSIRALAASFKPYGANLRLAYPKYPEDRMLAFFSCIPVGVDVLLAFKCSV